MSHKRIELALERQRLQLESARLRGELAAQAATQLALPFKALDLGLGALRWSRAHPLHLALAAGVLMVLAPTNGACRLDGLALVAQCAPLVWRDRSLDTPALASVDQGRSRGGRYNPARHFPTNPYALSGLERQLPEVTMSGLNNESATDTPHQQGVKSMVLAIVVPVVALVLAVPMLMPAKKLAADTADAEREVAARIQKVGAVEVRQASREVRTGEEVFKAQCITCHGTGALSSPKYQDAAAWGPRIATGFDALLNSALKGKNNMPAQGGGEFSDYEVARALVFMANAGGAKFPEPKAPAAPADAAAK